MQLNPFYTFFDSYRNVIYGTVDGRAEWPLWGHLAVWLAISTVLLALTTIVFKRLEPAFAKVL
jgi:ABC-type polysaccharide/polyol phosphate export permease